MTIDGEIRGAVEDCARRSHEGAISFGEAVGELVEIGVEAYFADYRRRETIYYFPSGATTAIALETPPIAIPEAFDAGAVRRAVLGAQSGVVQYREFMRLAMAAGCSGYFVWIAGRHVAYFGRRGETHVEHFPGAR